MKPESFLAKLDACRERNIFAFQQDFHALLQTADLPTLVAAQMRQWLSNYRQPPALSGPRSMNLLVGEWFAVDLCKFEQPQFQAEIITQLGDAILHFLTPADYRLYELQDYDNKVFSKHAVAKLVREGTLRRGEILTVNADQQALLLKGDAPIVSITLSSKASKSFCWKFCADSGLPLGYFNNFAVQTILELMARFIGIYGDASSLECLEALLDHESDNIKWQAAYAILRIDPQRGRSAFAKLSNSSSALLATSAVQTLAALSKVA